MPTPVGDARVWLHGQRRPRVLLVLGHGAGRGVDTPDLQALVAALVEHEVAVALVDQPWVVAGRKVAVAAAALDRAFEAVVPGLREMVAPAPLVLGGRSAGARVACRTAAPLSAVGVVALAFPLHPPGRTERSRTAELVSAGVPTLVLQGAKDPFGGPADVAAAVVGTPAARRVEVVEIPEADHSFRVAVRAEATAGQTLDRLVHHTWSWIGRVILRSADPGRE